MTVLFYSIHISQVVSKEASVISGAILFDLRLISPLLLFSVDLSGL